MCRILATSVEFETQVRVPQIGAEYFGHDPKWITARIASGPTMKMIALQTSTYGCKPLRQFLAQFVQYSRMSVVNKNISLRGLRAFCVAANRMSFRDAAESLHISASAVSHQIRNLEQELGQKLFDRDGASLTLSEAGKSLHSELNPLMTQLDEIASRHKTSASRKTLRVSVQPFFASELFIPRLAEFTARYGQFDIKVDTSDESTEKHPGYADASIRVFKSRPENLESARLLQLSLIPASSPDFRDSLKIKAGKVVSEFPRIIHDSRPNAWQQWQLSSGIGLPVEKSSVRLDSMIAVVRAAQRGLGAALVPTALCHTMFSSGSLVPLFEYELVTADSFYFVCDNQNAANEDVKLLRDWTVATFANAG